MAKKNGFGKLYKLGGRGICLILQKKANAAKQDIANWVQYIKVKSRFPYDGQEPICFGDIILKSILCNEMSFFKVIILGYYIHIWTDLPWCVSPVYSHAWAVRVL